MDDTWDAIQQQLNDTFPVRGGLVAVELVQTEIDPRRGLWGVVRLVVSDAGGTIRDIKEQRVLLVEPAEAADPRILAAIEGWGTALAEAGAGCRDPYLFQTLMPHDLWLVPKLLRLKRLREPADFEHALLDTRSRFGRFLG
ncbi:MAG: hypothetical protein KTR31_29760 [Myxococcales bacterium]|nr:hypothetical protein [Myxococcales bacterium]